MPRLAEARAGAIVHSHLAQMNTRSIQGREYVKRTLPEAHILYIQFDSCTFI